LIGLFGREWLALAWWMRITYHGYCAHPSLFGRSVRAFGR
jgi:hypothetical protein